MAHNAKIVLELVLHLAPSSSLNSDPLLASELNRIEKALIVKRLSEISDGAQSHRFIFHPVTVMACNKYDGNAGL
ncbi:MAG: hypothetical protein MUP41_04770 [Desulfobacterales bacterium]|nr:hypothetical protein [Desulfobacterales bacterium]